MINTATAYLAAQLSSQLSSADVPNPAPQAPPGLDSLASEWIGYFKWFAIVAGVIGLVVCAIMMMIGRRNRSMLASDGLAGIPWVIGGCMVVSLASTIVGSVL